MIYVLTHINGHIVYKKATVTTDASEKLLAGFFRKKDIQ